MLQLLADGRIIAWRAHDFDAGIIREGRTGAEQADAVRPGGAILAGDRGHGLRLVDRTEQRTPDCRIVKRRVQVIKAQDTDRSRVLGNGSNVAITRDFPDEVARWRFPPIDFTFLQGCHCRKCVQGQPFDTVEMRYFRS